MRLTPRDDQTAVELLAHLGRHWAGEMEDWVALRLSTEAGQSGFLQSDVPDSFTPVSFTLQRDQQVTVSLRTWGGECVAEVREGEIGRFQCGELTHGDSAMVIRRGRVDVSLAEVSGTSGDPRRGANSLMRRADFAVLAMMIILIVLMAAALGGGGLSLAKT